MSFKIVDSIFIPLNKEIGIEYFPDKALILNFWDNKSVVPFECNPWYVSIKSIWMDIKIISSPFHWHNVKPFPVKNAEGQLWQ